MKSLSILLLLFISSITASFTREQQIVIHWTTSTEVLKNRFGLPLFAGHSSNGDGCLATLGYYDNATTLKPFNGKWVELTRGTKIGDSSSGYGFSSGLFSFTAVFTKHADDVVIYPTGPAVYMTKSDVIITDSEPQPGQPLCVRFYDSGIITTSTKYNTVTGGDWKWPPFSSGVPVNHYFKIAPVGGPITSKWIPGDTFEDNASDYMTSISVFESNSTADSISDHAEQIINQLSGNNNQLQSIVHTQQSVIDDYIVNEGIITGDLLLKDNLIMDNNNTIQQLLSTIDILSNRILFLENSLSREVAFNDHVTTIVIQQDHYISELELIVSTLHEEELNFDGNGTVVIDDTDNIAHSNALEEYIKASDVYISQAMQTIRDISEERDLYRNANLKIETTVPHLPVEGWVYSTRTKWIYMTTSTIPYYYDSISSSWIYSTIIANRRMTYSYLEKKWTILN